VTSIVSAAPAPSLSPAPQISTEFVTALALAQESLSRSITCASSANSISRHQPRAENKTRDSSSQHR